MQKLKHIRGHKDWLSGLTKPTSTGLCPDIKDSTIYQLGYVGYIKVRHLYKVSSPLALLMLSFCVE